MPSPPSNLAGLTVLVVEDDPDLSEILVIVFRSCGANVLSARTAAAAMRYIETASKIDAVVTDIGMPVMDGLELARRIRRHPNGVGLPIIAITGFYETYQNQAAEFTAYFRKPVDIEALCTTVARVTERQ